MRINTGKQGSAAEEDAANSIGKWLAFIIGRRILTIVLCLVVAGISGFGLTKLQIDESTQAFFGQDNEYARTIREMEQTYSRANNVVILITFPDGDVFTPERLNLIDEITSRAELIPHTLGVSSLANHITIAAEADDIVVDYLYQDGLSLGPEDIDQIRDRTAGRYDVERILLSPDRKSAAVHLSIILPEDDPDGLSVVIAGARALADEIMAEQPGVVVRLSGGIAADKAFADAAERDLVVLVPIMLALIFAMLAFGYRGLNAVFGTVFVVILSVVTAIGIAGWWGVQISPPSAGTPVVIMTLCIADCVHITMTLIDELRNGRRLQDAIVRSIRFNFTAVLVTSLTTAVGFLSLNFSESPPIRDLGNMVAVGVLAGFVFSVTFLPAYFSLVPIRIPERRNPFNAIMVVLVEFVLRRRATLLIAGGLVSAMLAGGVGKIVLEDDFIKYFDDGFEFRRDTDYMEANLSGLHSLVFSIKAGEEYSVTKPEFLTRVEAFTDWLGDQENVTHVSSILPILRDLNQSFHADDPAQHKVPETAELAAQLLLFYEISAPPGGEAGELIDITKSETRIFAWVADASSRDLRRLAAQADNWQREFMPQYATPAAGTSIAYAHISEANIRAMIWGTGLALVIIWIVILAVLRDLRLGLISLLPNLAPMVVGLGLWGYLVGEVNLSVSIVGVITLGIVVDDTIHFLTKYQRATRGWLLSRRQAIRYVFRTVGTAITLTTVALTAGFLVLAQSGFAVTSSMGMLSAIIIAAALLMDLLVLPPLILMIDRGGRAQTRKR